MAIQDNRLTPDSIASLIKVDFNTKEEIVETDSVTTTASEAEDLISLDKKPNVNTSPASEAAGIYKSAANDKYNSVSNISKTVKTKQANISNARDFDIVKSTDNYSSVVAKDTKLNDILEGTKPINIKHDILSGKVGKQLDSIINIEMSKVKLSKYGLKNSDIQNKVKSQLVSLLSGPVGSTIHTKLSVDKLINSCFRGNVNYRMGDSWLIGQLSLSAFIDSVTCGGFDEAVTIINSLTNGTSQGRASVLNSLKNSLNTDSDTNVVKKVLLSKAIVDSAEDDKERDLLQIQSRGVTDKTLSNISTSDFKTNSSTSDYNYITSGMDAIDPNWKKDDAGNVNYYKVKDNVLLQRTAGSKVSNKLDFSKPLGDPVKTDIDDSLGIKIINTTME